MATTIEDLGKRVEALEREVDVLRLRGQCRPIEETPAERGARMLREARAGQPACSAAVAKWFTELGITAKPIGAEKLQEMMAARGVKPEDKAFSREIIEMREE